MDINANIEPLTTNDFWYDLTDGGYIVPEKILKNKDDADAVNKAVETLIKFKQSIINSGVVEEI